MRAIKKTGTLVHFVMLAAILTSAFTSEESISFDDYVIAFNKNYNFSEYVFRKSIFEKRIQEINEHNRGDHLYKQGVNHMTDWTTEEFLVVSSSRRANRVGKLGATHVTSQKELPFEIDYRTQYPPILTNIKNQGNCGSCWAHSAVEAIESHWAIATGNLHVLSQQQLTSCTPNPDHCGGSGGCSGSVESLAFDYVKEAGGLVEEWLYPYTSYFGDSGTCKTISTFDVVAKLSGFVDVPKDDQNALMDALAFKGPIAVSVDASHWSSYSGGIFDGCSYAKNITQNHAVQLVGYGHDVSLKKDYWIIRNSWGPLWGENGYMRLLKTDKPECGWDTDTHSGAACDGDPDEEWVCGMCGILSGATYPVVDVKQK